ncbi:MAG: tRNA uracil 4-sulfurtransferase ThiI [Candidatus Binatia bacterium]
MSFVVVRYHEITLKGRNRAMFASALARNIRRACTGLPLGPMRDHHGRLAAELGDEAAWPEVRARLARVFGIANFSLARRMEITTTEETLAALERALLDELAGRRFESFRIATRRADKRFPVTSPEVSARLGAAVHERSGARVDLDHAETTITIEILPGEILRSWEKVPGPGGLPTGTSGKLVVLLSGGIDSPVAAARMMQRGCEVFFVHFHSVPYVDRTSQEKCREIVRTLVPWQLGARLLLVPFAPVQRAIVTNTPPPSRVVLYRRMMLRIGTDIARRLGAEAVVTGDSLAQVASQTLGNIAVIEEAADMLVLRPLIGMDKQEVTAEAERLGTYQTSIEPDQDCCSLFTPRHPTTRARLTTIQRLESALDVEGLVRDAVASTVIERHRWPARPGPVEQEPAATFFEIGDEIGDRPIFALEGGEAELRGK